MSNDRPLPASARRRALFQVERLEDRALMSGLSGATRQSALQTINIDTPGEFVSQQASAVDATLIRYTAGVRHDAPSQPLTVNFSVSLGSTTPGGQPISLPASASETFTPVNESVTFPAGVSTETVRVPINSGAANPGMVPVELSVTSSSPRVEGGSTAFYLVTGPAVLPPTPPDITNAHLIVQRKTISGISIKFSQPMAAASVDDVQYYGASYAGPTETEVHFFYSETFNTTGIVRFKAAQYDPATNTLTLIPKKPLNASVLYHFRAADLTANQSPTNLQGTALAGNSSFNLEGHQSVKFAALATATIFGGN
jgi:hypothetical protein